MGSVDMGHIMTFSKAFAIVQNHDDFLLTFELKHSKRLCDIGRPGISVKVGTFPLHTTTFLLPNNAFF